MNATEPINDQEDYRDKIATVDESGKRVWIYPKKPKGWFTDARTYVSWILLAFLFGMPFIKVNGDPLLLFNVLERKFILFGITFMPQDFHLFVLAMLTFIVFIVLFTVVWGRLFCGWVCPQTIFMEMVFRKIEYWIEGDANAQRRLAKAPWTTQKIIKKAGKQAIFFLIAVLVANTFLAYIIGVDEVIKIATEPLSLHWQGFVAMILFSGAFYFVFSYLREQVCVTICPYGRLQGVMLDKNSIVVAYDFVRGEPRGKIKKNRAAAAKPASPSPLAQMQQDVAAAAAETAVADCDTGQPGENPVEGMKKALGDCIDCGLCVQVCPTGIDIRDGTQLECINCTACIDACDEVMVKVDRPTGLIRYDSYNGIESGTKKLFTPRVIAYTAVLALLVVVNIVLLASRTSVETLLLRTPGTLYQEVDETYISNLYNYQVINKTQAPLTVTFKLIGDIPGQIRLVGQAPTAEAGQVAEGALFIDLDKEALQSRKTKVFIEVYNTEGEVIDKVKTNFLGPVK
ncbi:4Fe-4S dicluster domain-containing protein [Phaeodactylibacter luteus]|uniref:4Fe-4S binding protein n=1 Tax=Phaeodactylibacter luteus TaxID=1564516 RepID=A0A5C6RG96_9BACT|nr:4Fe-4S dicluster domain-containing protein [Phaeodactylibacter luteus]TXB60115.1 4Fe-4S binding protein [Phaeodactylibacter luteus]